MWSPQAYETEGRGLGLDDDTLSAAIAAYERIRAVSRDLEPVLTLGHLARLTDVSYQYLRGVVSRDRSPYLTFHIRKRGNSSSATRLISVPEKRLKSVQSFISSNILSKMSPSAHSFAYHPGSSIMACAVRHAGSRWLVKLDIQAFFESIREDRVYKVFRDLGYGKLISFEMARICTVPNFRNVRFERATYDKIKPYHRQDMSSFLGSLPMGASTSPMISNLCMRRFDDEISQLGRADGLTYSRYADDIFLSTNALGYTRKQALAIARKCCDAMSAHGLIPNHSKTVISPPGARKIVLGLVVNDTVPRLAHEFKSRLRMHYFFIRKYGASQHAIRRQFNSTSALQRHLEGLIQYASSVEPVYGESVRKLHQSTLWPDLPE